MTALGAIAGADEETGWQAKLDVKLGYRGGDSYIRHLEHYGPLRIQRPFYPEGRDVCHVYLLHPPGGMVSGDALAMSVSLERGAKSLVTTPSAGKIYLGNDSAQEQSQHVKLSLDAGSELEWLPQETIVFNGARGRLYTEVDLEADSRLALWDMVCLGRPASSERFEQGYLQQKLLIRREQKVIYRERNDFVGGSDLLQQPWGMAGQAVTGTLILTCKLDAEQLDRFRQQLSEQPFLQTYDGQGLFALSQVGELLVARYLGPSAAQGKAGFEWLWSQLRIMVTNRLALRPRIWNT